MKNNLVSAVLALGLIVLYFLHFSEGKKDVSSEDKIEQVNDSTSVDSLATVVELGDSSFLDSLRIAEYSKVGYLDIEQVVAKCPSLRVVQEKIYRDQQSIAVKERDIKVRIQKLVLSKQKEAKDLEDMGLLTQAKYESLQAELGRAQQEGEQQMANLQEDFTQLTDVQNKFSKKLDNIIGKGIEKINEQVKLDYILIEKREMNNVYALNKKNDITDVMIKYINSQKK